jgi:hypothetical protein
MVENTSCLRRSASQRPLDGDHAVVVVVVVVVLVIESDISALNWASAHDAEPDSWQSTAVPRTSSVSEGRTRRVRALLCVGQLLLHLRPCCTACEIRSP